MCVLLEVVQFVINLKYLKGTDLRLLYRGGGAEFEYDVTVVVDCYDVESPIPKSCKCDMSLRVFQNSKEFC